MSHDSYDARLSAALQEWQQLLGERGCWDRESASGIYGVNTIGTRRDISAALKPDSTDEVVEIVQIANNHRIPLYPISGGKNWGYGSANPVHDKCVLVDLQAMDKIQAFDSDTGVITLQPGVTQQSLRNYLDQHKLPFLVPVHGGGPDCSIIGNTLERGYGITPYADHFFAMTELEAVMPDGSLYRSALSENNGAEIDKVFKWGLGPYLDGIFSQGNFGIITSMSIALAPIPEQVYNFFFWVEHEQQMEEAVVAIRSALREVGMNCGSINLMNALRILSMMEPFPTDQVPSGEYIPQSLLAEMSKRNRVTPWMGTGAIYGSKRLSKATKVHIRKHLGKLSKFLIFLSPASVRKLKAVAPVVPGSLGRDVSMLVETLNETVKLIAGEPSEIALPLSYWRSGTMPKRGTTHMDPARDNCGIIWYSPLIPMKPDLVRQYVEMVKDVCMEYGLDPLITLTSVSDRCFDSTVPLLYERSNPEATERARECYVALFNAGKEMGFLPYRMGVDHMNLLGPEDATYWKTVRRIKQTLDPNDIIAPGRYQC